MNKKELIEGIEAVPAHNTRTRPWIDKKLVLGLVRELDEPQKVQVPQFVADWYEEHKKDLGYSIWNYIYYWDQQEGYDFKDWFDYGCCGTIQTLVNMHQFGYEVEKEPKYTVRMKGIDGYGRYLNKALLSKEYFFASNNEISGYRTKHTRKELEEDGFGWVFDCPGIEIEEVE